MWNELGVQVEMPIMQMKNLKLLKKNHLPWTAVMVLTLLNE